MNEKIFHITWTTYNSRVSERMKLYKVKPKNDWIFLDDIQESKITKILWSIIEELNLKVYAYNICKDHIHLLLQCEEEKLSLIVWKLKWKSTKIYKDLYNIEDKIHLWGQKFNKIKIENKKQFFNAIDYIRNNRIKHWLEENNLLVINFYTKIK
jgi:REP element-mobilizing transposase RayT